MDDKFAELHASHGPALLRFLTRLTGGAVDQAEDLLQETMVRAWRSLDAVPADPEAASRWLYAVARHAAVDAVRMRRCRPAEVFLYDLGCVPPGADTTGEVLAATSIQQAFARLSYRHQRVLRELHFEGRTVEEIADRLRIPIGTVRSRAFYAMRAIRADLELVKR